MASHLAFNMFYLVEKAKERRLKDSDDSDEENDDEQSSRKKRLISHRSIYNTDQRSTQVEKVGLAMGLFFVASMTAYAVYTGYNEVKDHQLSEMSLSSVVFDAPEEDTSHNEARLSGHFLPYKYILYMYPNITNMNYTGLVKIRVKCTTNTSSVILHSTRHRLGEIAVKTLNVTDIEDILVTNIQTNVRRNTVSLNLNQFLVKDYFYDLYIGFHGNISTSVKHGMHVSTRKNNDGKSMKTLSTMFLPDMARYVFPCFDEPAYRAKFELIVLHGKQYSVISNMAVKQIVKVGNYYETHFHTSPALSTYQYTFILHSDLISKNVIIDGGIKVTVSAHKDFIDDAGLALRTAPVLATWVAKQLRFNLSISKLELVCVPSLPMSSVSSYGIVQMRQQFLLYNELSGTLFEREKVIMEISKVISAQWFGGIVTFDWWDKQWLINGLVKLLQRYSLGKLFQPMQFNTVYYDRFYQEPLRHDESIFSLPLQSEISEPSLLAILYNQEHYDDKGSLLLSMLFDMVEEKGFLEALKTCLKNFNESAIDVPDFSKAFALNSPEVDVVDFLHYWTNQGGFPLVKATNGPLDRQLSIVQSLFTANKNAAWTLWRFQLPVIYTCSPDIVKYDLLSHNDLFAFPRTCANDSTPFPSNDWYKVNAGGRGFYRADYSKVDWVDIKRQLDTNHTVFSEEDRANLINDLFEFAKFDSRSIADAMSLTSYLKKETQFLPIQATLKHLDYLTMVTRNNTIRKCLKEYTTEQIVPAFKNVASLKNKTVEQKHLFHLLIERIVEDNTDLSKPYLEAFDIDFLQWLVSAERDDLPNYIRDVILKVGVKLNTKYEWNDLERYYKNASTSDAERSIIVRTLAQQGMKFFSNVNETFSKSDIFSFLSYNCDNDDARSMAITMLQNSDVYESLTVQPEVVQLFLDKCVAQSRSSQSLEGVKSDLQTIDLKFSYNAYLKAIESADRNINFIANQLPELLQWIEQNKPTCLL